MVDHRVAPRSIFRTLSGQQHNKLNQGYGGFNSRNHGGWGCEASRGSGLGGHGGWQNNNWVQTLIKVYSVLLLIFGVLIAILLAMDVSACPLRSTTIFMRYHVMFYPPNAAYDPN